MKIYYYTLGLLFLFMTGCAASSDPRTGGFFGGVHGLATGTYEQRIEEREQSLARLRAIQQDIQVEEAELQEQKGSLEELILWEKEALWDMQQSSESLVAELNQLESQDLETQSEVMKIKEQIAGLQQEMQKQQSALDALEGDGIGDSDADFKIQQLINQRESLRQEYDMLLQMTLDLAS